MKDNYEINIDGVVYVSKPEPSCNICAGCAFDKDEDACDKVLNMQPSCSLKRIVWVKKDNSSCTKDEGDTNMKQESNSNYYTTEELVVGGEYDTHHCDNVKVIYIKKDTGDDWKYVCVETESEAVQALAKEAFKLKKKVDWSKVPVDTKIIVEGVGRRYFAGEHKDSSYLCYFNDGTTSWSTQGSPCYYKKDKISLA